MADIRFAAERVWTAGEDDLVVEVRLTATGRQTGIPVEQRVFLVWTVRDGKALQGGHATRRWRRRWRARACPRNQAGRRSSASAQLRIAFRARIAPPRTAPDGGVEHELGATRPGVDAGADLQHDDAGHRSPDAHGHGFLEVCTGEAGDHDREQRDRGPRDDRPLLRERAHQDTDRQTFLVGNAAPEGACVGVQQPEHDRADQARRDRFFVGLGVAALGREQGADQDRAVGDPARVLRGPHHGPGPPPAWARVLVRRGLGSLLRGGSGDRSSISDASAGPGRSRSATNAVPQRPTPSQMRRRRSDMLL